VCQAQPNYSVVVPKPPHGIPPKNASMVRPAGQYSPTNNGILYHGGPVLNNPHGVNVYYIWYGNWSGDTSKQILTDFIQHLGGSPYFNINTSYYDYGPQGQQDQVFNKVNFSRGVDDNYSLGKSLSDLDVAQVVANHTVDDLPIDENGVYFVLTSADVTEQEDPSVGGPFCAWHAPALVTYSPGQNLRHQGGLDR
jgi:hypothetical protein